LESALSVFDRNLKEYFKTLRQMKIAFGDPMPQWKSAKFNVIMSGNLNCIEINYLLYSEPNSQ